MKNKGIDIKNYLSTERYTTRKELMEKTGLGDREVRSKISELKKYAIYLEKKKEIDEYMSSDIETFNINKLDNYSLEDLRLIKKRTRK